MKKIKHIIKQLLIGAGLGAATILIAFATAYVCHYFGIYFK